MYRIGADLSDDGQCLDCMLRIHGFACECMLCISNRLNNRGRNYDCAIVMINARREIRYTIALEHLCEKENVDFYSMFRNHETESYFLISGVGRSCYSAMVWELGTRFILPENVLIMLGED